MSLLILVGGVFAQDTDDYEWEIVSLEFEYPEDWEIEETEQGTISVISDHDVIMNFFAQPIILPRPTEPFQALTYIIENAHPSTVFDDPEPIDILDTIGTRLDYTSDFYGGMLVAFVHQDEVILIDAFVPDRVFNNSDADSALDVLETLQSTD
ncbi:MAG: hypothetical protein AAF126_04930 [Chloroflexota bacterium]